jgi:hypothetical protein
MWEANELTDTLDLVDLMMAPDQADQLGKDLSTVIKDF